MNNIIGISTGNGWYQQPLTSTSDTTNLSTSNGAVPSSTLGRPSNWPGKPYSVIPIMLPELSFWPLSSEELQRTVVIDTVLLSVEDLQHLANTPGQIVERKTAPETTFFLNDKYLSKPLVPDIPMAPDTRKRRIILRD